MLATEWDFGTFLWASLVAIFCQTDEVGRPIVSTTASGEASWLPRLNWPCVERLTSLDGAVVHRGRAAGVLTDYSRLIGEESTLTG